MSPGRSPDGVKNKGTEDLKRSCGKRRRKRGGGRTGRGGGGCVRLFCLEVLGTRLESGTRDIR